MPGQGGCHAARGARVSPDHLIDEVLQGVGLCGRHAARGAHAADGNGHPVGKGVCIERALCIEHEYQVLHQQFHRGQAVGQGGAVFICGRVAVVKGLICHESYCLNSEASWL